MDPTRRPAANGPTRRRARAAMLLAALLAGTAAGAAEGEAAAEGEGPSAETGARGAPAAADERAEERLHEYPTVVIADYVLGCMVANGNTHQALQQCACSIDFIRGRMDYATYEEAATILQIQRDRGQRGIFYRDSNWAKNRVEALENLQAESTLRCF